MKYIVYGMWTVHGVDFRTYTIHDDEEYEVKDDRVVDLTSLEVSSPTGTTPHIIIRKIIDGRSDKPNQVDLLTGDFVAEFDDVKAARVHAFRMQNIHRLMTS
mgnify:CR=1 FL=1